MKIVLLGLLYTEQSLADSVKYSTSGVQMAPHLFQQRMISGFEMIEDVDLKIYSVPPTGSFPINDKRLIMKGSLHGNHNALGYLNLPILKQGIRARKIKKALENELNSGEETYVLAYTMFEPFLKPIKVLKKSYKNLHSCVIQTDCVPGIGDMEKYMTSSAKRRGKRLVNLAKNVDKFIVLTDYLAEAMEIGDRPYMVMECICDEGQVHCESTNNEKNICLYTGTTEKIYGICDLVDAFKQITNAELWICGSGECDEYIREAQKHSQNIKHLGFLNQDELASVRDKCNYLINPRRPTGTYTKYSFPSKTAEYLMSGKPCIMYKLEGVPDEYDQYINYLTAEKPDEIANELRSIFGLDYNELLEKGMKARIFMLSEKTSEKQAKRVKNFLCDTN